MDARTKMLEINFRKMVQRFRAHNLKIDPSSTSHKNYSNMTIFLCKSIKETHSCLPLTPQPVKKLRYGVHAQEYNLLLLCAE